LTVKKPYTLPDPRADQNFSRLYSHKLESRFKKVSSGTLSLLYQSLEAGETTFSATGSATVSKSFGFEEKQGTIVFAMAHAKSPLVTAHVTDVTQTGITIECRTVSGTAAFSAVTTAAISVYYAVIGSSP
jgi:hypothetical protein